ncbi:MAG: HD-GYP domain-containing protein, partial [Spirochaetales bacterium]|nr:HD-GYP domain-containing protein [Spirochaetales bacterium]
SRNKITFVATGLPATVTPHSKTTFGAVIYATELMSLESYTLSGYKIIKMKDLLAFQILSVISALWFIGLITSLIIQSHTEFYLKRQELDSKIIMQSIKTLTNFIDAKDAYTKGHSTRVAEYSAEIARRMKMKALEVTQIYYIALLHDCGKIGIPDVVLNKPEKLTNDEYNLIKSHTTTGSNMLQNFTAIPEIRDGAHYHHERFDGTGYPSGLIGTEIPLCARIICVADSFDAMSSNRCYRNGLNLKDIIIDLNNNSGKQFDPIIVPYMEEMIEDGFVDKIQKKYPITDINFSSFKTQSVF